MLTSESVNAVPQCNSLRTSKTPLAGQRRLLLVEDNFIDREYFIRCLNKVSNKAYIVLEAECGSEALELCSVNNFDCIIVDYLLPDINGLEFMDALREKLGQVNIPTIVVTGCGSEAIAVQAMKKGARDYLIKGQITPEILEASIHQAIEKFELQRQLKASQEQLKFQAHVLSQIHDAVYVTECGTSSLLEPRIAYVNAAFTRMTGYNQEEILGQTPSILTGAKTDPQVLAQIDNAIANCQPMMAELINYRKDGSEFWVEVNVQPMVDDTGNCVHTITVQRDISDRKLAEIEREQLLASAQADRESAEAANRIKDQFLAVISHELRSPLNAILGWTKLLQSKRLDEITVLRALSTIARSAQLQNQLIEDLLDFSRITEGKLRLELNPIDLVPVIEDAVDTVRPLAENKGIAIETIVEFTVGQVIGDYSRLQQVIGNLLSNAIKFTPEGGRIAIVFKRFGADAQITVTDTGIGINPEFLPYIFEQFRQADNLTTTRRKGLGLGLAIALRLVEMHNGSITAKSEGEGQGASFTIKLPIVQP